MSECGDMSTRGLEKARRFPHDTHIASILSTTGCLRFSLKMDFEVKTSRQKKIKLNVNLSSCLNLYSIWDLLKCMIAILVYKYCQQHLYKKVYKYCYSLPPKVELVIMIIFLFCYGVLMKSCFYLKNHN